MLIMSKSPKLDPRLQYGGYPSLEAVRAKSGRPVRIIRGAVAGARGAAPTASLSLSPEFPPQSCPLSRPRLRTWIEIWRSAKPRAMTPEDFGADWSGRWSQDQRSGEYRRCPSRILDLWSCPAWHLAETSALQAQHRTHWLPDDDTSTAIDAWMAVHRKQQALTPAYETLRGFDQDGFR
jgi:hypothetical protein